jgi:iron(III) transport system substrate-binding protein
MGEKRHERSGGTTMKKWIFSCPLIVVFFLFFCRLGSAYAEGAQTAEQLLQGLNRLPETERHARLVAGAKKEGTVVWYVAMARANADELVKAFEAEYPFLKVNVLTGRGASLLNRIIAEYRANRYQYDLFNTRSTTLNTLKKAGAIMRYHTPLRRFLRAGFYDDEGYLNGLFATPLVFLFNTKLVQKKNAPQTIEDLLGGEWKGKLGMDTESYDWLAAAIDYYGEKKGKEIGQKLGDQNLQLRSGPTLLAQLVSAGEFPVQVDSYHQEAIRLKKAGAPVDYVFPKPYIPVKSLVPMFMASHSPNPNAAALLADFLLSKTGQGLLAKQGRWVSRKDMPVAGPDDVGDRNTVIPSPDKWGTRYKELVSLYNELIVKNNQ